MSGRGLIVAGCLGMALASSASLAWGACYDEPKSTTPTSRYVLSGAEARDQQTGLTWQRCSVGQSFKDGGCTGEIKTFTWDQAQKAGAAGWRLPTRDELETLVTKGCVSPALNSQVFPNTDILKPAYWTSSAPDAGLAWLVFFDGGSTFNGLRGSANAVRLVKGGK